MKKTPILYFVFLVSCCIFAFCFLLFAFFDVPSASAFTMSDENYILEMGNLNSASGFSQDPTRKVTMTVAQTDYGLYDGKNYRVRAGFQYIAPPEEKQKVTVTSGTPSEIPSGIFSFSLSQTLIDFGIISPTNPVVRTHNLTVLDDYYGSYNVKAYEDHELLSQATGAVIPDTTCDNGYCTQTASALWQNALTYGFGYRCDNLTGKDCASGFENFDYYKNFADNSKNEASITVMSGDSSSKNKVAQITYKLNISGTQSPGYYSNQVIYIAAPNY